MNKKISKYFWDLNKIALAETEKILRNPKHPKFAQRLTALLSRCQQPKELFSYISKDVFVASWPKVRSYWAKFERDSDFRDWWQTIYEQIAHEYRINKPAPKGGPSALFLRIGKVLRNTRIQTGISQSELALRAGIKQPDISKIEEGKKNITLGTLGRLCKVLGIKKLDLE